MPPVGFEPAIPGSERPQTHALDHAAIGIGPCFNNEISSTFPTTENQQIFTVNGARFIRRFQIRDTTNLLYNVQ